MMPPELRAALEMAVGGVLSPETTAAAAALSARYRAEVRDGTMHVSDAHSASAYATVRMPATYAAVRAAMAAAAEARPDFAPRTMLDAGSGPGTAAWAAADAWGSIKSIVALEGSRAMAELGRRLWDHRLSGPELHWREKNLEQEFVRPAPAGSGGDEHESAGAERYDLVSLAYVLNELRLPPAVVAERLWDLTSRLLLIVEPGTSAGWRRILEARAALLGRGASLAAPCPHAAACPLAAPDWCHFSQRVARSREHRLVKGGELGWEDEKFIYIAALRPPVEAASPPLQLPEGGGDPPSPGFGEASAASTLASRVLMPPRTAPGRVWLKLCQPDGTVTERLITKREGDLFKRARRADWGDRLPGDGDR